MCISIYLFTYVFIYIYIVRVYVYASPSPAGYPKAKPYTIIHVIHNNTCFYARACACAGPSD